MTYKLLTATLVKTDSYSLGDDWIADRNRRGRGVGSWQDWRAWNAANPGKPKDSRGRWTDSPMDQRAQRGGLFKVDEGIFLKPDQEGFRNEYGHRISDLITDEEHAEQMRLFAVMAAEELAADVSRPRGAFDRLYARPVRNTGYDKEPTRFGRGRLQVTQKAAMVVDLGRMFGLTADLTKRKRGSKPGGHTVSSWNAANPEHPKDSRGRWTDAFGGGQSAVESLLASLVREHKAEKTKLGAALMGMLGVDPTAKPNPAKPLTAVGIEKPDKPVPQDLLDDIAAIRKRPIPGDQARLEASLGKLTIAQIKDVGEAAGVERRLISGTKKKQINTVASSLTARLESEAITHGVNDVPSDTRPWAQERRVREAEFRRRKALAVERGDRDEYQALVTAFGVAGTGKGEFPPEKGDLKDKLSRMHTYGKTTPEEAKVNAERFEAAGKKSVSEALFGGEPLMGSKAWFEAEKGKNPAKPLTMAKPSGGLAGLAGTLNALPVEAASEERARQLLKGLKVAELKALRAQLGDTVSKSGTTKARIVEDIVHGTVSFKLRHKARIGGAFGSTVGNDIDISEVTGDKPFERLMGGAIKPGEFGPGSGPPVRYLDTPPKITNKGHFGAGDYHGDGQMGVVVQGMTAKQRSIDVGGERLDDALGRAIIEGHGGTPGASKRQVERFKEIAAQVADPEVKARIEATIRKLDQPSTFDVEAAIKPSTPAPLAQLMRDIDNAAPNIHKPNEELSRLAKVAEDFDKGKIGGLRFISQVDEQAGPQRHESQEGWFEVKNAIQRAVKALNELYKADRSALAPKG